LNTLAWDSTKGDFKRRETFFWRSLSAKDIMGIEEKTERGVNPCGIFKRRGWGKKGQWGRQKKKGPRHTRAGEVSSRSLVNPLF